jgi:hypothetical protein
MTIPGYVAEVSLYKTTRIYHAHAGTAGDYAAGSIVPSQICGDACDEACGFVAGAASGVCLASLLTALAAPPPIDAALLAVAFAACETAGVGAAAIGCVLNCPSCPSAPPGPECCLPGKKCSCGGRCVAQPGGGSLCVGGLCLDPRQVCP